MAVVISVEEASSHFIDMLSRLSLGAPEIVIARDGQPIARLLPISPTVDGAVTQRVAGGDKGQFSVPPEFFDPLPNDILDSVYGDIPPQ